MSIAKFCIALAQLYFNDNSLMVFYSLLGMEFARLLPRIVESLVSLLENGGDREPDIIEQVYLMILENIVMGLSCFFFLFW